MWVKRLGIVFTLLSAMILSATAIVFANPKEESKGIAVERVAEISEEINVEKGIINKPKDFVLNTVNDAFVVSGTGRENDKVTITLYKRVGDEYVQMGESIELKIGPLGVFTKELSLKEIDPKSPKETVVSKDTLLVLQMKRGDLVSMDYRLIKFSDDKEVKKSLDAIKLTPSVPAGIAK